MEAKGRSGLGCVLHHLEDFLKVRAQRSGLGLGFGFG